MKNQKHPEYQYLDILRDILDNGFEKREFNSGIAIKSVFGRCMRFDLSKGFPLLTTKKVFLRGIIHELLLFLIMFISGMTGLTENIRKEWKRERCRNCLKTSLLTR